MKHIKTCFLLCIIGLSISCRSTNYLRKGIKLNEEDYVEILEAILDYRGRFVDNSKEDSIYINSYVNIKRNSISTYNYENYVFYTLYFKKFKGVAQDSLGKELYTFEQIRYWVDNSMILTSEDFSDCRIVPLSLTEFKKLGLPRSYLQNFSPALLYRSGLIKVYLYTNDMFEESGIAYYLKNINGKYNVVDEFYLEDGHYWSAPDDLIGKTDFDSLRQTIVKRKGQIDQK